MTHKANSPKGNNNTSTNMTNDRYAILCGAALMACLVSLAALNAVDAVVVDGKRGGPSALKNQSRAEDMIDGYNTKTCGISDPDTTKSNFVNAAKEGQFPWLVSFQIKRPSDGKYAHFCMGSFISDKWILSAAHCFADSNLKPHLDDGRVRATGGSTNAYGGNNANFTIKRIFYHSKFDKTSPIGFDVSLVEVNEPAKIRTKREKLPFVNSVCLPVTGKEYSKGQAVKLAGWGDTESKDPKSKPDFLLQTDMLLSDGEKCADIFSKRLKKVKNQYHNYKDFLCAEYKGERDACQGDSGSSLLEYADGKAVAVGIVSYGLGCATKGAPGVYERVSSLMPWIKDITKNKDKATVQHIMLSPGKSKS